jgi:DNA end-binding protein Ku
LEFNYEFETELASIPLPLAPPAAEAAPIPASRSSWTGQLQFGKLNIPVKAYSAVVTSSSGPLHQVHARCGQLIQYRKTCPRHGEVTADEISKAFTYAPGDEVILSAEELATLEPANKQLLKIDQVVVAGDLPWELLSGRTLYLVPANPVAAICYALVAQVLAVGDRWALGMGAISERRQPLAVHVVDGRLLLHVLHWPAQRRSSPQFDLPSTPASGTEVRAMEQILAGLSKPLNWAAISDQYEQRLMALVQAKLSRRGATHVVAGVTKRTKLKRGAPAAAKRARAA